MNILAGNRKVAIIGAGFVGASIAYALTLRNIARDIVLIDIDAKKAAGEALDIQHGIPYMGKSAVRAGDYSDCKDCDLIVITAGRGRRPGESRLQLMQDNSRIMRNVVDNIQKHYTRSVILVVSNPADILTYLCDKWMGLENGMVFGTGCVLDSSRLVRCVADYVKLSTEVVKGTIVGEHGDSQIPIWSRLAIAGVPMEEYCENVGLAWGHAEKDTIADRVKTMGAEIIAAKGKTHYGIATCVGSLADAVLNQRLTIASVSTTLQGEYGVCDVALSIPSIIGVNGVERRLEENWDTDELSAFRQSAITLKNKIDELGNI
ncbi:MAG: L-lactate dehydrogenase [Clostridia bacterium]|nr:L-lactate dehydrogenase [Clostridia bacterium]